MDDIDKDLSTKESPENEKDDSRKGIKALTKNSQATTRNTATTEASKELKDQTNKVASQKNIKITILLFLYMDLMVMHQELVPLQEKVTIGVVTVSKLFKIIELKVIT